MKPSSLDGRKFDVIVCGAGSAGVAAAWAAAVEGANTVLFERHGFAGGILTAAMIHTFDAIKSCRDNGITVVAGFASVLLDELAALGGVVADDNPPEALTVHPELLKVAVDRLLQRAGVTVVYHAPVHDVLLQDGRVTGVVAALRDGQARVAGHVTIDATGDADLVFHVGAGWTVDPALQPLTYHFRLGGIAPGHDWRRWEELTRTALQAAHAAGEIDVFGGPWIIRLGPGEISLNTTRVQANPLDPLALSAAEAAGRAQMLRIWEILRRRVPELAASYILAGASQLHIRESRKIRGDYMLTEQDIWNGTRFPDAIAVGAWPIDIHPTDRVGVHPHKDDAPVPYEIPYRCLLPQAVEGLLVAGKPISTTHRAHGSTRVPGTSIATGQAAGTAAALAVRSDVTPRKIDIAALRSRLRAQRAIVSAGDSLRS